MGKKETELQRVARNAGLDINLQDIMDSIEDELLVIDKEYRVRFANSVVRGRFQKGAESPIGRLCYKVFHDRDKPCAAPLWDCPLRKVLQSGSMATAIHPVRTLGADKYLKITAYPLQDRYGDIKAVVELRRDVTAERELETQILRRHHQLLALSHISSAVSGLWDLDAILTIALIMCWRSLTALLGEFCSWTKRLELYPIVCSAACLLNILRICGYPSVKE